MSKYSNDFEKIRLFQETESKSQPDLRGKNFDLNRLDTGWFRKLVFKVGLWLLLWFVRLRGRPVRDFFIKVVWIVDYHQVVAALRQQNVFRVPFGLEMTEMAGGTNFALGDDGELHKRQRAVMIEALRSTDYGQIGHTVNKVGEALLADAGGSIDAVRDFIVRTTSEVCLDLYGIKTESADEFAQFSMAGSALLFADIDGEEDYRQQAMIGAARLRSILDANMDRIASAGDFQNHGLLGRLLEVAHTKPEEIAGPDGDHWTAIEAVRAMMFGLITGFVPTNALGAAKILEELARRPDAFAECTKAARAYHQADGDDARQRAGEHLERCLMEAARLNPALAPGQLRVVDLTHGEKPGNHYKGFKFRQWDTVMVGTAAALRDPSVFKNPDKFDPYRTEYSDGIAELVFGYGPHDCIGAPIAKKVITEIFLALLGLDNLGFESKKLKSLGPIPWSMRMSYAVREGHRERNMITASVPLVSNLPSAIEDTRQFLRTLHADEAFHKALEDTGIVHFASLNVVDLGDEAKPDHRLLLEFSVDGAKQDAIDRIFRHAGDRLESLEQLLSPKHGKARIKPADGNEIRSALNLLIQSHTVEFHTLPWGAIGMNFPGAGEFSAKQIDDERALYSRVEQLVAQWPQDNNANAGQPSAFLYSQAQSVVSSIRSEIAAGEFANLLYRPSDRFPGFTRRNQTSFLSFIISYLNQDVFKWVALSLFLLLGIGLALLSVFAFGHVTSVVSAFVGGSLLPYLLLGIGLIIFVWILRRHETVLEQPDDRFVDQVALSKITAMEDLPGHVQNHLTSVSPLKPGVFRLVTTALALHIIGKMSELWFKRGFIIDFATIHYAKWYRLPGTRKLIFQTNYDGSWESYLEDFITKVHGGQTIAWNNAVGFPKTNWLFLDGARDGDQFKRWVRRQQVETLFWFSRNKTMTTGNMRRHALVRDGLARARSHAECTAWLDLFMSHTLPKNKLETDHIQTLLFNGLPRHPFSCAYLVRFNDRKSAGEWLEQVLHDQAYNAEYPLRNNDRWGLCFGDGSPDLHVRAMGLSSAGVKFLGLDFGDTSAGLNTFPTAFLQGMKNRSHVLDDDPAEHSYWHWHDGSAMPSEGAPDQGNDETAMHMILLHYARSMDELDVLNARFEQTECVTYALNAIRIDFDEMRRDHREPFGFRDGVSQPVMTGTNAFAARRHSENDAVEPGEFILGYRDTRGYFNISPQVRDDGIAADLLPPLHYAFSEEEPWFDNPELDEFRDVGRNGSFLCIRQLAQDPALFDKFVKDHASDSQPARGTPSKAYSMVTSSDVLLGDKIKFKDIQLGNTRAYDPFLTSDCDQYLEQHRQELFKSKMMGRWPDGSSLARHPVFSKTRRNRARYYNRIMKQVEGMAKRAEGEHMELLTGFLNDFGRCQRNQPSGLIADMNLIDADQAQQCGGGSCQAKVVWDDGFFRRFKSHVDDLRSRGVPLEIPARLLAPVVPDNEFMHGIDDPQGQNCPIGSHVRRTNPRDSFNPGDEFTLQINNRHRLLRRGRTFDLSANTAGNEGAVGSPVKRLASEDDNWSKGTFFACFNANIERQFEFVQQTWMNSRTFHDGHDAPDPIVSRKRAGDRFVVPNPFSAKPVSLYHEDTDTSRPADFVKVQAGGYFFVPGKQALLYFSKLAQGK